MHFSNEAKTSKMASRSILVGSSPCSGSVEIEWHIKIYSPCNVKCTWMRARGFRLLEVGINDRSLALKE